MHRKEILTGAAGALAAGAVFLAAPFAAADQAPPVNAAPVRPPAGATAPPSFADVVERVAPAVVSIEVEGRTADRIRSPRRGRPPSLDPFEGLPFDLRRFFPQFRDAPPRPMRGAASGFFISADGYILTNNHVVDGAQKITVRTPDERDLDATVVGRDPATDLAVLKVQGRDFPFVNLDQGARPRV